MGMVEQECIVDRIAEQLVMEDLSLAEVRKALVLDFEALQAVCEKTQTSAQSTCEEATTLCRKKRAPKNLAERLGALLNRIRAELLEGRDPASIRVATPELEEDEDAESEPVTVAASQTATDEVEIQEEHLQGVSAHGVLEALPEECDRELLREFLGEAREHMDIADAQLLVIEQNPCDSEAVNAVFRAFHTLKGVSGFLGLQDLQALAHESENLLEKARQGEIELTGHYVDATFESVDALKKLLTNIELLAQGSEQPHTVELHALIRKIAGLQIAPPNCEVASAEDAEPEVESPECSTPVTPSQPMLASESKFDLETVDHDSGAPEELQSPASTIGVNTSSAVNIAVSKQAPDLPAKESWSTKSSPQLNPVSVPKAEKVTRIEKRPIEDAGPSSENAANAEASKTREVLKVDAERLDRLVDMIGELVIAESMVSQSPELKGASTALARHLNQLEKITRELQEIGTSLRMIPIRSTFQKIARLVRDTAKKAGKQVEFSMGGEDTELDKAVVEKIGDPLIHMVRNSVDHGIEPDPNDRVAVGKSAVGRISLRAFHRGGNIYIELTDDGRGLNKDAILAKAKERGLVKEGEILSDREIYNLIFAPGLSTAKTITDVSGRGVGMDVVKRNIEALRGQIDIHTELGKGTTFTIRLPLTLAIIDGMLVRVGFERYIIPTLSVVRSVRPTPKDIETVFGRGEMLNLHEHLVPIFRLHSLFNIKSAEQDLSEGLVVVVEDDGRRAGIFADELLGQQQIVIKSLGESLRELPGLSGGAIMPDGSVGLILDVSGLVRLAHAETTTPPPRPQALQHAS